MSAEQHPTLQVAIFFYFFQFFFKSIKIIIINAFYHIMVLSCGQGHAQFGTRQIKYLLGKNLRQECDLQSRKD